MKVKDFREVINGLEDPEAEIIVFFLERDEFENKDGEEVTVEKWNKAVKEFDYMNADQAMIETVQEMIWRD